MLGQTVLTKVGVVGHLRLDHQRGKVHRGFRDEKTGKLRELTSGYGGLILRKAFLTGEVQFLSEDDGPEWPLTKEKQRELELLDKEIQKLMK